MSTDTSALQSDVLYEPTATPTLLFMKHVSDKCADNPHSPIEVPDGGSSADMVGLKDDKEIGDKIDKIIGHLMNHSAVSAQKPRMSQDNAIVHISASRPAQVQVKLPAIGEQLAIATTPYDTHVRIASLEQHRDSTRAIKQGMMQALLDGRIRLIKQDAVSEGNGNAFYQKGEQTAK